MANTFSRREVKSKLSLCLLYKTQEQYAATHFFVKKGRQSNRKSTIRKRQNPMWLIKKEIRPYKKSNNLQKSYTKVYSLGNVSLPFCLHFFLVMPMFGSSLKSLFKRRLGTASKRRRQQKRENEREAWKKESMSKLRKWWISRVTKVFPAKIWNHISVWVCPYTTFRYVRK